MQTSDIPSVAQIHERDGGNADGSCSLVLVPRATKYPPIEITSSLSMASATTLEATVLFGTTQLKSDDTDRLLMEIHACLGVITLGDSSKPLPHLVVVTAMTKVCTLLGAPVYRIDDTALIEIGAVRQNLGASAQMRAKLYNHITAIRCADRSGGRHWPRQPALVPTLPRRIPLERSALPVLSQR